MEISETGSNLMSTSMQNYNVSGAAKQISSSSIRFPAKLVVKEFLHTGSRLEQANRCKETARCSWVLVVTELLSNAVNDFDAARCSRVLFPTEVTARGAYCLWHSSTRSPV